MPFLLSERDLEGIHGTDERVSVEGLSRAIHFYLRLLRSAAGMPVVAEAGIEAPRAAAR